METYSLDQPWAVSGIPVLTGFSYDNGMPVTPSNTFIVNCTVTNALRSAVMIERVKYQTLKLSWNATLWLVPCVHFFISLHKQRDKVERT